MSVGYGAVAFAVRTDDSTLPRVIVGDDRLGVYTATIRLTSGTVYDSLDALLSFVTVKPALGRRGGKVVVDTGPGVANLTIPVADGAEEVWTAILTRLEPLGRRGTAVVWADATWLCLKRTTPP